MSLLLLGIALSSAIFFVCFPIARLLRRLGMVDVPNGRSSHTVPTARGGGLVLVLSMVLGIPLIAADPGVPWFLAGYLLVAGVSFADDMRPLHPLVRASVHAVGGMIFMVPLLASLGSTSVLGSASLHWAVLLGGTLLLVGYTNAFNFMDGINGLAAGQATLTGLGTAALGLAAGEHVGSLPVATGCIVAFSSLGFLPHNFPRARMFMGDVGSAPLGFALAAAAIGLAIRHGLAISACLAALHANFLLDTGLTLFRRALLGERWYKPHREHFYQRLVRSGFSHTEVTCAEMSIQGGFCVILVFAFYTSKAVTIWLVPCVAVVWLGFFAFCESRYRTRV